MLALLTTAGSIFHNCGIRIEAVSLDTYNTSKLATIKTEANLSNSQFEDGIIEEPINKLNPIELGTIIVRPENTEIEIKEPPINTNNPIELKTIIVVPEVEEFAFADPINKDNPIQLSIITVTPELNEIAESEKVNDNASIDLVQLIIF